MDFRRCPCRRALRPRSMTACGTRRRQAARGSSARQPRVSRRAWTLRVGPSRNCCSFASVRPTRPRPRIALRRQSLVRWRRDVWMPGLTAFNKVAAVRRSLRRRRKTRPTGLGHAGSDDPAYGGSNMRHVLRGASVLGLAGWLVSVGGDGATIAGAAAGGRAAREATADTTGTFNIEEATITEIQKALLAKQVSTKEIVELYLTRIKAYNGTCVEQPQGLLGPVTPIAHAGQLNALGTLNLRPAARKAWGFDDHKARSMTDAADSDPSQPDALETAAAQDRELARTGQLAGPLHGVVVSIKDQFDTFDMRTTNGAQVAYANDRPPHDSTVVARLRSAGAIVLAKANRGGFDSRSGFGGTVCNAYDTERTPRGSSSGSAVG